MSYLIVWTSTYELNHLSVIFMKDKNSISGEITEIYSQSLE